MKSERKSGSKIKETQPIKIKPHNVASERQAGSAHSPLRPERRIGYAVVGLGRLALMQILPAMTKCKYSKPVALVSRDAQKAKKVALQYGIPETSIYDYEHFDDIKNNPEIEVVYIVLPNSLHEEYTIRAAKAGKHVLCEKPMSTSIASAQRMIDVCKTNKRKLMIAYRIQYEPINRQCMKWLREEKFGKVRLITSINAQNIGDPEQWRLKKALSGGGSLPDIGIYNINTARFLLGEEPESVLSSIYTTPKDPRFTEVEEAVMFQMFFPGGTIANCTCSYGVHESRHYRCYGDKGGLFGVANAFAYGGLRLEVSHVKDNLEWNAQPSFGAEKDQFAQEMDHMSQCVLNDKIPYTPGEEGLQDLKIMEAIYESAQSNKLVKLERITKLDAFRGTPPKKD
ncbi:MAG: Gfo/Idh/MocA family oxidoreductase [Phycisphaerae bacterium]|nr:Gfo/Idh/MocA family oxidoreductase [Saprospiraceae bacterium]